MQTLLKLTVLFLTMLIINSCGKDESKEEPMSELYPFYQHLLYISFQDVEGNDLVEGSEFIWNSEFGMRDTVKPEYYTLDIIFEDGIPNPWKQESAPMIVDERGKIVPAYILDIRYPRLYLAKRITSLESLEKSLWFETHSFRTEFAEKIIFRLTCSYLFGDNEAHDIITWWELLELVQNEEIYFQPSCYRIELEGKEFPVEDDDTATIILDK